MRANVVSAFKWIFLSRFFIPTIEAAENTCKSGAVRIKWPHPGLVQPLLLAADGVRTSIDGLQEGEMYYAYLRFTQGSVNQVHKEFVWSDGHEQIFEMPLLPDGTLELELQVFSSSGCVVGSTSMSVTLKKSMGLENPSCAKCLFTTGWASAHFTNWVQFFSESQSMFPLPDSGIDILEIGSWEGMSGIWLSHHLKAQSITCVDTWKGGVDQGGSFANSVLPGLEGRFDANMREAGLVAGRELVKLKGPSAEVLPRLLVEGKMYHVIYVDGAHTTHDVMMDAVIAVRMLHPGGRLLMDDYRYFGALTETIDAFHMAHAAFLDRIDCGPEQACFVLSRPVLPAQPQAHPASEAGNPL